MRIEEVPFAKTALGRRVVQIVSGTVSAAAAARDAYRLHAAAARRSIGPVSAQVVAEQMARNVMNAAQRVRSMGPSQKDLQLGTWKPFDALHSADPQLAMNMRSREAREARTMAGAGLEPTAYAPFPEITLPAITAAHRRADSTGWVDRKCDIGSRYLRANGHLQGIDRTLRSYAYTVPYRILPRSPSRNSVLVCRAVKAAWEKCDGWRSSVAELGVMSATGFATGELVWDLSSSISIPIGKRSITIPCETIARIAKVYPRNLAFDITDDKPWLCAGPGRYLDITEEGLQKFIFVAADGSGPTRYRGYQWATDTLCYLAGLSLEKWGTVIETWGLSTPILFYDQDGRVSDNEIESAIAALEDIGIGRPTALSSKFQGKDGISFTPTPTGLAPMHAQICGYLETQMSKAVQSSTMQTEASPSGNGSFALAEVHRGQGVDVQKVNGCITAEAITTQPFKWLCEANADTWGRGLGIRPEEVVAECPRFEWVIGDETPAQRLSVFQGVKNMGFDVDEQQVRDELGVRAPMPSVDDEAVSSPGFALKTDPAPAEVPSADPSA